jgi:hypothetical protein
MEPKQSTEDMVRSIMEPKSTDEQQVDSSTTTEQPVEKQVSTGEVQKTQEPVQKPETDKGFASHPAWQEREAKLKETRQQLEAAERRAMQYQQLLDGLQKQRTQGAPVESGDRIQKLAEKVCSKYGWNINQLNEEQRAYVQDQVKLTIGLLEEAMPGMLENRFKPLEQMAQEIQAQKQLNAEEMKVKQLAAEKFPMFKWEEHIQPSINKVLNELDQIDPEHNIKLSYEELFYRAVIPLYQEMLDSKGRQEARDTVKQNARPLGAQAPAGSAGAPKPSPKLQNRDDLEAFVKSFGVGA